MTIDDWAFSDLSDHPKLVDLLLSDHGAEPVEESGAMANTPVYIDARAANAMISDIRQTTIAPQAILHFNALLDELLCLLLQGAQSINPVHLRTTGIPAVFSAERGTSESTGIRALGRAAVGEAEVELRSWYDSQPDQTARKAGYPPQGQGRGLVEAKERVNAPFPHQQAWDLFRVKCVSFSTMAPHPPPEDAVVDAVLAEWVKAGGDPSDATIEPSALWITGILEYFAEHVLAALGRVVARDSSAGVATVQDLYVTLCEDETVWGMFRRLKVKDTLEAAIRTASNRSRRTPNKSASDNFRPDKSSPLSGSTHDSGSSAAGAASGPRGPSIDNASRKKGSAPPEAVGSSSFESTRLAGLSRKTSTMSKRLGADKNLHERTPSVLSANTRKVIGVYNDMDDGERSRTPQEEVDDFDELVRSGQTMKVSLTPSRLKTFEATKNRPNQPESPTRATYNNGRRGSAPNTSIGTPNKIPAMPNNPGMSSPPTMAKSDSVWFGNIPPSRRADAASPPSRLVNNRLTARAATTTEEGGKESLMDLLAAAPPAESEVPKGKRVVPAVILGAPPPGASFSPREGPSGANKPLSTSQSMSSFTGTGSRPRQNRMMDEDGMPRRKGRSEAQELADFFNSTPPPSNAPTSAVNDAAPSTKSAKGFRGLMSKMTGKRSDKGDKEKDGSKDKAGDREREKVKDRERERGQMNDIPTAPTPVQHPRRQKSLVSVPTSQPSANADNAIPFQANQSPFQTQGQPPVPLPPKGVARTGPPALEKSRSTSSSSLAAPQIGTASPFGVTDLARRDPALQDGEETEVLSTIQRSAPRTEHARQESQTISTQPFVQRAPPEGQPSQRVVNPAVNLPSGTAATSHAGEVSTGNTRDGDSHPMATTTSAALGAAGAAGAALTLGAPLSSKSTHSERTPTDKSDANSFQTANEGVEEAELESGAGAQGGQAVEEEIGVGHAREDARDALGQDPALTVEDDSAKSDSPAPGGLTQDGPGIDSLQVVPGGHAPQDGNAASPANPPATTIPPLTASRQNGLSPSDLSPLRGLLTHATSVAECRLLLNAVLSQLGVPQSSSAITPEDRVAAWLLAGEAGPSTYSAYEGYTPALTSHVDEQEVHAHSTSSADAVQGTATPEAGADSTVYPSIGETPSSSGFTQDVPLTPDVGIETTPRSAPRRFPISPPTPGNDYPEGIPGDHPGQEKSGREGLHPYGDREELVSETNSEISRTDDDGLGSELENVGPSFATQAAISPARMYSEQRA